MLALADSSDVVRSMPGYSQIANVRSSADIRKIGNYLTGQLSHSADVTDDSDKNGGPNHLRAWMEYRGVKGIDVARALGGNVTPGMVSDLINSNRALSAKWLRRLAPILDTTPGMLLDHDPRDLDTNIVEMWAHASNRQRKQIVDLARVVVERDGTTGG